MLGQYNGVTLILPMDFTHGFCHKKSTDLDLALQHRGVVQEHNELAQGRHEAH
jgi:hypothetical protein